MEAAQRSSLHGVNDRRTHSNTVLLMNLHQIVENSQWPTSVCFWYYSLLLATSMVSWPCYTQNKLDTESKGSTRFRNLRAIVKLTLHLRIIYYMICSPWHMLPAKQSEAKTNLPIADNLLTWQFHLCNKSNIHMIEIQRMRLPKLCSRTTFYTHIIIMCN